MTIKLEPIQLNVNYVMWSLAASSIRFIYFLFIFAFYNLTIIRTFFFYFSHLKTFSLFSLSLSLAQEVTTQQGVSKHTYSQSDFTGLWSKESSVCGRD